MLKVKIVQEQDKVNKGSYEMPEFYVTVSDYENSFIVNNVNILQEKENIFVSMPS